MTKKDAWEYAFGMIQVDNLTPSSELIKLAHLEIAGKISMKEVISKLDEKYKKRKTV